MLTEFYEASGWDKNSRPHDRELEAVEALLPEPMREKNDVPGTSVSGLESQTSHK